MDYKIIAGGVSYISENDLREALGISEESDIFLAIRKLKEDKDLLEELYTNHISQLNDYAELAFELGIGSGDAENIKDYIISLKKERDELKEKCDKLKARTNAMYGASCGYSASKQPAFRCNVISYSWEIGSMLSNDSIRVELDLTPTANYKGTFDMEDLKKYIQEYGREKKLGIVESVDYQNAKAARAELAFLYKTVLGKDRLDTNLSPHEVMKAILDEYKRAKDSRFAFSQSLQSVYMHIYEGTGYNTSDIYAAPDKLADWIITRYDSTKTLGHMETLCDINDFIDEFCNKYNVVQPERIKTTRERLDYIFKVLADYRGMHDSEWNRVEELKKERLENLRRDLWEFRKNAIEDLKSRGFFFRPEENETLPEIYSKLLKRYDDYFGRYKEQYRLRQCWHVRWESENERANGVQKALDREREKCRVKDISLETTKKQYEKVCSNLETAECALNGMKSKVRSLQEEKTKVITALGQDIWDDCLKEVSFCRRRD